MPGGLVHDNNPPGFVNPAPTFLKKVSFYTLTNHCNNNLMLFTQESHGAKRMAFS